MKYSFQIPFLSPSLQTKSGQLLEVMKEMEVNKKVDASSIRGGEIIEFHNVSVITPNNK